MLRLSLTLTLILAAYLCYLFAPIPGMSQLDHQRLHSSNIWGTGDIQIIKEREDPSSSQLWITGSSVASSLFPTKMLDSHFDKSQTRLLHLTFSKFEHINTLLGKKGIMTSTPKKVGCDLRRCTASLELHASDHAEILNTCSEVPQISSMPLL